MTGSCPGQTHDRYRTLWRCELQDGHGGLCRDGSIQWEFEPPQYRPALRPVRFRRVSRRTNVNALASFLDAPVAADPATDAFRFRSRAPGGPEGSEEWHQAHVGEWIIIWSDGGIEVMPADRFETRYEHV